MPFLITLAQQLTSPQTVIAFYQTPAGIGVAVAETICCILLYRRIVRRERRLVDQAREGR
jgi:hypothetical protein